MGETQQPILNGAYYGPSVPPKRSYHSHGRSRSLCCFPCCLIGFICKLIAALIVLAGIAALVLWLVYRPTNIKFHVVNASLTEFNLTSNSNNITYNLALDISVRNPNRRIGVHYDRIEAQAFYEDERFGTNMLSGFYQRRKNTTMLNTVFQGNSNIRLSGSDITKFDRERNDGTFSIDVRIYLRVRFRIGRIRTSKFKPTIKCDLRVPFSRNGASPVAFDTKRCKVDF